MAQDDAVKDCSQPKPNEGALAFRGGARKRGGARRQSLAPRANNFVNTAAYDNMETVYIIPGYNKKLTQMDF